MPQRGRGGENPTPGIDAPIQLLNTQPYGASPAASSDSPHSRSNLERRRMF